jgi:NAD(P)-dependent dehydrogenase (short-subunit alcohol dehydrogenase family)
MTMRLENKVAIVIGGASGMGEAISHLFAREGAAVAIADVNEASAVRVANEVAAEQGRCRAYRLDVVQLEQVADVFLTVSRELGAIDILINASGLSQFKPTAEITPDDLRRTVDVNLIGAFYACQEAGRVMIPRRSGKIVNFGSTAGIAGVPYMSHYTAAKHGVVGFTKSLAVEWSKYNVNVNCICPGATETPMFVNTLSPDAREQRVKRIPLQRFGKTRDQANTALFLASSDSDYLTGSVVCVDGGAAAISPATATEVLLGQV